MNPDPLSQTYLNEIGQTPLLSRQEEFDLAHRVQSGDLEARDHMIRANLRLVVKIANDYKSFGLPVSDLVAEGNIGLMKAVERFDPERGAKFSTYASWWIKQSIRRALSNHSRTVRLPVHMIERINKVRKASRRIEEETGRSPRVRELQRATGFDAKQLRQAHESGQATASLDAPVAGDDYREATMHEILEDERMESPSEQLSKSNMLDHLTDLLSVLDPRERYIIEARFGLLGANSQTLEAVGKKYGVTRERIRQIQEIALKKMRAELDRRETALPQRMQPLLNVNITHM